MWFIINYYTSDMRIARTIIFLTLCVIFIHPSIQSFNSPYSILKINKSATNQQLQKQYKLMRSKYRKNRGKKQIVRRAYQQILFERQFNTKDQPIIRKSVQHQSLIGDNIDQNYVYGYKLSSEFDDGKYFQNHFNASQFIQQRINTSQSNTKIATLLMIFGGFLLKIAPCIFLICFCRNRMRDDHPPFQARLGSRKFNHRPH